MQVSVENTSALERKLTVHVPAADIDSQVSARLQQLSKQVRIKGFRPGRIPIKVMEQRYGRQIREEIVGQVMQQSLRQAIEQESLRLAGMPKVDADQDSLRKGDLQYTATLEVLPEIGDVDVSSLQIQRPEASVTGEDIDDMLQTLRRQRATWSPAQSEAAVGDRVQVEYVAEFEGGQYPQVGKERVAIVLGSDAMFAGFEGALEGVLAGDEKSFKVDFPDAFRGEFVAGKSAQVSAEVLSVESASLPEVDGEFAKAFGIESGDLDDLRAEVRANLERELSTAMISMLKLEVTNQLLQQHADLQVPESLIDEEAKQLQQRSVQRQKQAGVENPEEQDVDLFRDAARRRVAAGMLIGEIAKQQNVSLDRDRVKQSVETIASTFEEPQQVVELYYSNPNLLQTVENSVLEEQVVDWVLEKATSQATPMSFKEVIARAAQQQ